MRERGGNQVPSTVMPHSQIPYPSSMLPQPQTQPYPSQRPVPQSSLVQGQNPNRRYPVSFAAADAPPEVNRSQPQHQMHQPQPVPIRSSSRGRLEPPKLSARRPTSPNQYSSPAGFSAQLQQPLRVGEVGSGQSGPAVHRSRSPTKIAHGDRYRSHSSCAPTSNLNSLPRKMSVPTIPVPSHALSSGDVEQAAKRPNNNDQLLQVPFNSNMYHLHHQQPRSLSSTSLPKPSSDQQHLPTPVCVGNPGRIFPQHQQQYNANVAEHMNQQIQMQLSDIYLLRESNSKLKEDNQELLDLCCFLDDERQQSRKLAKEWQRFGRYTASVLRQEVAAYQHKLKLLDSKQEQLLKDNMELKELCIYLDQERSAGTNHANGEPTFCPNCGLPVQIGGNQHGNNDLQRDDGDGSSATSTNVEELGGGSGMGQRPVAAAVATHQESSPRNHRCESSPEGNNNLRTYENANGSFTNANAMAISGALDCNRRTFVNEEVVRYISQLEKHVTCLEQERRDVNQRLRGINVIGQDDYYYAPFEQCAQRPHCLEDAMKLLQLQTEIGCGEDGSNNNCTEREGIPAIPSGMRDGGGGGAAVVTRDGETSKYEKYLLQDMCQVAWKKLEKQSAVD